MRNSRANWWKPIPADPRGGCEKRHRSYCRGDFRPDRVEESAARQCGPKRYWRGQVPGLGRAHPEEIVIGTDEISSFPRGGRPAGGNRALQPMLVPLLTELGRSVKKANHKSS